MIAEKELICPHCNEPLDEWEPNAETGWEYNLYLCNNNSCSYFVSGRKKLFEEFDVNFAYRYCYNPKNSKEFPIVCWCGGELSLKKAAVRMQ